MSTPAQPYIAPWATEFRRYSVQAFPLVPSSGSGPVTPTWLGAFTQAEWPPSGGAVSQGQVAEYADTYGGLSAAGWPLEYRPDLDSTKSWRRFGNLALAPAYVSFVLTSANYTGPTAVGSFELPIAGDYLLDIAIGGYTSGASSIEARLGTTSTGNDIATAHTASFAAETNGTSFTATKGQTIYVSRLGVVGTTNATGYIIARAAPVKVQNA